MATTTLNDWRRAAIRAVIHTTAVLATLLGLASPALAQAPDSPCPPTAQAPTPAQLQTGLREARDRGLLWRLEKDGLVGWLYGTLHVGKLAWAFPGPQLTQALRQAQTVALELDLGDPGIGQALQASLAEWRQRQADRPLPPALLARLAALARAECVASAAFEQQPLLMQAMGLVVLSGRRDGLDPAFAQEFMLGGFAKAGGKTVVSLETPASQLAAMAPQDPAELQASLTQAVEQLESGQARRLLARVADVWARGDLATLARYEDWCECANTPAEQAQMRRLNDERNAGLAQAIHAQLLLGRPVLAAVGALHMTGPQALPRLMAERGWTVQRVPFDAM